MRRNETGAHDIEPFVKDEYKALSAPLQPSNFSLLEESCLRLGILQPIIIDGDGAILDGMNRFTIAKKHDLSFDVVLRNGWSSESEKRQWIASQRIRHNKFSNQQLKLTRYHLMCLKEGTIEKRANECADEFAGGGVSRSTVVKRFKMAHDYGQLATSDRICVEVYSYIWQGNSILERDLRVLSKISHGEQRKALEHRIQTNKPWKKCIRSVSETQCEGLDHLMLMIGRAKAAIGSAKRWIQLEQKMDSDVGRLVDAKLCGEMSEWERRIRQVIGSINEDKV